VRPKTTGARLGSDVAGANGDLSVYWLTNPNNTLEGNVAAATEGWGFFVHTRLGPRGLSAARWPNVRPHTTPLARFDGNSAHSVRVCCEIEADNVDGGDSPTVTPNSPPANWQPKNPDGSWADTVISGFSCHHAFDNGFWARMGFMRLVGTRWADTPEGVQMATTGTHVSAPATNRLQDSMCACLACMVFLLARVEHAPATVGLGSGRGAASSVALGPTQTQSLPPPTQFRRLL
jgi:hypothetical protein